jgi:short-subunit dehydrogenase
MRELRNRVVVITGASSGFGKGTAEKFARNGAHIVLAARRENLLEKLARDCGRRGVRALVVETDVSRREQVEQLAQETLSAFGRIDVWINNAGVATYGRYDEVPLEEHEQVIRTNLLGVMYGSYAALRQFRRQGHGTLINVGSFAGISAAPYFSSYCASKFGVRGFDMALRQELQVNGERNIHVSTIIPTSMDTPFFSHAANHLGKPVRPIPPFYDPQEVIDAIYSVSLEPQDELVVGRRAKVGKVIRRLAPKALEHKMASQSHSTYMDQPEGAPESSGNLFQPVSYGNDVYGGWQKRSAAGTVLKTGLGLAIPALLAWTLRSRMRSAPTPQTERRTA